MNRIAYLLAAAGLLALTAVPACAQNDAGPNDTHRSHDYARHIGSRSASKLSTGWTSGHGSRTHQTHDYYRHTRSGHTTHVHGYYHSSSHRHY